MSMQFLNIPSPAILLDDDFAFSIPPAATGHVLRRFVRKHPDVQLLIAAHRQGTITDDAIAQVASEAAQQFVPGTAFRHVAALAAIAVICETIPTDTSEDLLLTLSRLSPPELRLARDAARLSVQERLPRAANTTRSLDLAARVRRTSREIRDFDPSTPGRSNASNKFVEKGATCNA